MAAGVVVVVGVVVDVVSVAVDVLVVDVAVEVDVVVLDVVVDGSSVPSATALLKASTVSAPSGSMETAESCPPVP